MAIYLRDNNVFVWDRKDYGDFYCDIKDVLNFYRIFDLSAVDKLGIDNREYKELKTRMNSILHSYDVANIKRLAYSVPSNDDRFNTASFATKKISADFIHSANDCLGRVVDKLSKKEWFLKVSSYFSEHGQQMNILKKMRYDIRTSSGMKHVDLEYAANFRFKARQGFFNLLHMQKKDRGQIIPSDDNSIIYVADFRQFEFRTYLDLHPSLNVDFGNVNLYEELGLGSSKVQVIAYLYGQSNKALDKKLRKNDVLDQVKNDYFEWSGQPVILNDFDEKHKRIHTIVQTISQYYYLDKLDRVMSLIGPEEGVSLVYPFHDSVILSVNKGRIDILHEVKKILEGDVHKVKEYMGKNYGEMKELK